MDFQEVGWGGMDWIDMVQDRDRWQALVNAVMNLCSYTLLHTFPPVLKLESMSMWIIYKLDRITAIPMEESLHSKKNVVITYGNKL